MEPSFLDTLPALQNFLDDLGDCDGQPPRLYIDLEGNNLSRNGTLSLVTILLKPEGKVHLVDITTLGELAFDTAGADGRTLRKILESEDMIKVFFDIRNDSDALFGLYKIRVAGIEDLQLMEIASRTFAKRNVNGLAKCIERDSTIAYSDRRKWQNVKNKGKDLFDPQRGGSYAVFDQRPLSKDVMDYCIQDVTFMPHLRDVYRSRLCDAWWLKIETETTARIQLSQSLYFRGKGQHMAQGPPGWLSWTPSPAETRCRTFFEPLPPRESSRTASHSTSSRAEALSVDGGGDIIDVVGRLTTLEIGSAEGR